jgi:hypothetical protein
VANRGLWRQVVAEASQSEGIRRRLMADPAAVLKEYGLEVPKGELEKILAASADGEISDDDFSAIAGGSSFCRQ